MTNAVLVPLRPAAPAVPHRRYRVVGLAAGLGLAAGAGIALLGVAVGLSAHPTVAVAPLVPATPDLNRVPNVPAFVQLAPVGTVSTLPDSMQHVQWASWVLGVSSQYSDQLWAARAVLGAPDTFPRSGDIGTAWASRNPDSEGEFIEVAFARPMRIRGVVAVETFNPGAVTAITAGFVDGSQQVLVRTSVTPAIDGVRDLDAHQRMFDLHGCTDAPVASIRIELDSVAVPGWNELDAIGVLACQP